MLLIAILIKLIVIKICSASDTKWNKLEKFYTKAIWPHHGQIRKLVLEAADSTNFQISSNCRASLRTLATVGNVQSLKSKFEPNQTIRLFHFHQFSSEVLDSWPKVSPGFISGDQVDFGHYDQCMEIPEAQYCMVKFPFPLFDYDSAPNRIDMTNTTIRDGHWFESIVKTFKYMYHGPVTFPLCLPEACSKLELEHLVKRTIKKHRLPVAVEFEECQSQAQQEMQFHQYPTYKIVAITLLSTLVLWTTIATLCSTRMIKSPELLRPLFDCFNANANLSKLFEKTTHIDSQEMAFLNGARFIIMFLNTIIHFVVYTGPAVPQLSQQLMTIKLGDSPLKRRLRETLFAHVCLPFVIG